MLERPSSQGPRDSSEEASQGPYCIHPGSEMRRHQRLRCEAKRRDGRTCPGAIGFFWEPHEKVRGLDRGEHARPGCDAVPCLDCGTRWEIRAIREERRAA